MEWHRILITGASSGLGWALAVELARPGVELFLSGRDQERLSQLAHLVQERGAAAHICVSDLSTVSGRQQLIDVIEREVPDLLINNAGVGSYGLFVDTELEQSEQIIQVNVMALMAITYAWSRALISRSKSGKVIFVSSSAALLPCPGMAAYAASKAFLNSFAEALRFELKDRGIAVLTVCPGYFTTNFQRRASGRSLVDPSSPAAFRVARQVVRVIEKEGVCVLRPWRWLLTLRWLFPHSIVMNYIRRRSLRLLHH